MAMPIAWKNIPILTYFWVVFITDLSMREDSFVSAFLMLTKLILFLWLLAPTSNSYIKRENKSKKNLKKNYIANFWQCESGIFVDTSAFTFAIAECQHELGRLNYTP